MHVGLEKIALEYLVVLCTVFVNWIIINMSWNNCGVRRLLHCQMHISNNDSNSKSTLTNTANVFCF